MRLVLTILLAAFSAQAADNPTVKRLLDHWNKSKEYTIELARQMPADQYTSRPNAEEMTFGEQMVHIANAIRFFTKSYVAKPQFDTKKTDKETALADLNTAFDDGAAAIASLSDGDLPNRIIDTGEGKMTAIEAIMLMFDHTSHHRAQAVVYLRYKGIKPADYRF